jgi:hypothetical protein
MWRRQRYGCTICTENDDCFTTPPSSKTCTQYDPASAGIDRLKPGASTCEIVRRQPALTLRGTPMPSPSGASLDIKVTVRVPGRVVSKDRDTVPPGPTMPVHISVAGVVVVVGVVGVSDPQADVTTTTHNNTGRRYLCIVSGERTGWRQ